jgi:hypothetical protein
MSRFSNELKVIPRTAWILACIVYLGFGTLLFTVLLPHDHDFRAWSRGAQLLFSYGVPITLFILFCFSGYVYGDAKRRGMRYVMWTLLAIFIPDGIGIILYFILRSPMPKTCPGCSQQVPAGFAFCPHCGTALQATCPNCGRGAELGWANCPNCGTRLPSQALQANSSATSR